MRLEELRLEALEARIDADLELGRHAALVAELEALIARHPMREHLQGQLMLALYRCGRDSPRRWRSSRTCAGSWSTSSGSSPARR